MCSQVDTPSGPASGFGNGGFCWTSVQVYACGGTQFKLPPLRQSQRVEYSDGPSLVTSTYNREALLVNLHVILRQSLAKDPPRYTGVSKIILTVNNNLRPDRTVSFGVPATAHVAKVYCISTKH